MRDTFLPFHRAEVGDTEIEAVVSTLRSGWLTSGPRVRAFEEAFARSVNASHAVATNSGTAALHLALEAAGVGPGDEVVVPAMTFTATAAVVVHLGATPVVIDVTADTLCIDPEAFEAAISPRTRAVMPVDYAGHVYDVDAINDTAQRHGIATIEDAAHSWSAAHRQRPVGSLADVTCFSFYATKPLFTGEGGMATTDDAIVADRIRLMGQHGLARQAWDRSGSADAWYYAVTAPGFKYNMPDIAAALGMEQLPHAGATRAARERIALRYNEAFGALEPLETPGAPRPEVDHAWHLYVLRLRLEQLTASRSDVIRSLREKNIGTSVHFIPLHMHPYYRDTYGWKCEDLPVASSEYERLVSLPIYPAMTEEDVDDVIAAVTEMIAETRR